MRTEPSVPAESSRSPRERQQMLDRAAVRVQRRPRRYAVRLPHADRAPSPLTSRERPSVVAVRVSDSRRVSETASTLSWAVQSLHSGVTREPDTRAVDVSRVRGRVAARWARCRLVSRQSERRRR